jgi:glycosyltransferase involved in cell wall biosynthesis
MDARASSRAIGRDFEAPGLNAPQIEVSVVLPCLNEISTLGICIDKALRALADGGVRGEVVVADNGSTDGSQALSAARGARVVPVTERGYGAAVLGGIRAARGAFVVQADADDSYDLSKIMPFIERLRAGDDLVVGNRFWGGIEPGAMPFLNRYLGNPALSTLAGMLFGRNARDFHCGLRAMSREKVLALDLQGPGMEFATEMIARALMAGLRVSELPIVLHKDGRARPSHLRPWRDGLRHVATMIRLRYGSIPVKQRAPEPRPLA